MALGYLLDTNICIYVARRRPPEVLAHFARLRPGEVGKHYGEIRADLERAGLPIGNNDLWIAAHARALGVTLVSNDTREFDRVAGLSVANWAA